MVAGFSKHPLPPPLPGTPPRRRGATVHYFLVALLCSAGLLSTGLGREGGAAALLAGPDDFMRMVQVIDRIDGQAWSDSVQRRLDPPFGVDMHWSRLADLPLAALISLTEPWFGRERALYLSVLLAPSLLGGLLAASFLWGSVGLLPERRSPLPILMLSTLIIPLLQMLPGRVDHHGLQGVLTVLAIGCLIRALQPGRYREAAGLGFAGGVSLAVGLETLPFLGAATVILGLTWVRRGGTVGGAMGLTYFGAALTGTAGVLLVATLPREAWAGVVCDRLSIAHVMTTAIVLAAGAAALALEHWWPRAGWRSRLLIVGGVGVTGLALVAAAFPECAGTPYANLPDDIRFWFVRVEEARTLADLFRVKPNVAIAMVILPVAALVALVWQWMRASDRSDPRWLALVVLVLSGLALVAWQVRGVTYAGIVAGIGLVPLAAAANERAHRSKRGLARIGLRLCIPFSCLFAVLVAPQAWPGPVQASDDRESGCDVLSVRAALTDPAGLGAEERTIAAPIDAGPGILFLTRHKVLAAPYHRNIRGLADNRRIFAGTESQALATIHARGVGAILFCRKHARQGAYPGREAFLNDRLASDRPPWWLVPVARGEGIALYEVHRAARAVR